MDAPAILYALRWLIHDTFRQALTSRVFWILLGMSALCIVFCLGITVEGGAVRDGNEFFDPKTDKLIAPGDSTGHVSLLFGVFNYTFSRGADEQVGFLLNVIASWVAGVFGLLAALIFTAGFIPESLQPGAAAVLLAKPVPRWLFLTGKYLGVVCFVALHVAIFFLGTFFALGFRTGVWHGEYLLGIPLLVFHFATIFAFSVLIAALTRNTMACVVGSVVFWFVCFAVNHGRHFAVVYPELHNGHALPAFSVFLSEAGYWLLPKPVDLTLMLENALNLGDTMAGLRDQKHIHLVLQKGLFYPIAAVISSCLFPIFALWAAASHLAKTDY